MPSETIKPFSTPTYTQFSNPALDYIMPSVKGSTWKIICFTIRHTFGWHRQKVKLTYEDFKNGTGLGSQAIHAGIKEADDLNMIIKEKDGRGFSYSLNRDFELPSNLFENQRDKSLKIKEVRGDTLLNKENKVNSSEARTADAESNEPKYIPDPLFDEVDIPEKKKKKKKSGRDPRLDHPAVKTYRHFARLYVPVNWRDRVIEAVGDQAEDWGKLVDAWVGLGWNPANVRGMVEAWRELGWEGFKKKYSGGPDAGSNSGRDGSLQEQAQKRSEHVKDGDLDEETVEKVREVARRGKEKDE